MVDDMRKYNPGRPKKWVDIPNFIPSCELCLSRHNGKYPCENLTRCIYKPRLTP